ncbi:MAG TPA: hypothetical protein VGZ32_17815 [Actinocrinis sp.]|jgi:hypothetical protein|uniref:hypothetical protein n=1 Tax=Actinocrinis sp. TaxID=1920516 RepID=UPI002DDCFE6D|nr:hypothetical protein [Actinocrinis sp.]HEV3172213.1 hypothetical protein [Actinocrinis sp.]
MLIGRVVVELVERAPSDGECGAGGPDPGRHILLPSVFDLGYTALSRLALDELI